MKAPLFYLFLSIINVKSVLIHQDCGCDLVGTSKVLANCSNRTNINFKCLSESRPYSILLQNNNYSMMPFEIYQYNFNETRLLDFSRNLIEHLPDNLTESFKSLLTINFSYNSLTNIKEIFGISQDLQLGINHNPFDCNCNDPDLHQLFEHTKTQKASVHCYLHDKKDIFETLTSKCDMLLNTNGRQTHRQHGLMGVLLFALIFCRIVAFANWVQSYIKARH